MGMANEASQSEVPNLNPNISYGQSHQQRLISTAVQEVKICWVERKPTVKELNRSLYTSYPSTHGTRELSKWHRKIVYNTTVFSEGNTDQALKKRLLEKNHTQYLAANSRKYANLDSYIPRLYIFSTLTYQSSEILERWHFLEILILRLFERPSIGGTRLVASRSYRS
ncbi:hypothetical protein NLU13_5189 [Sarocladium strictum]|uniref:Uncharacterized protein n=1 Tax=Sarocladium strictum TaxID=5046 RepID=A0AA39GH08_SARSR|nr:hypothetical protein NLU13_5189 [Sarocladium strictum]